MLFILNSDIEREVPRFILKWNYVGTAKDSPCKFSMYVIGFSGLARRICHPRSSLAFAGRDAGPYSLSLIHPIENRFFIRVPISCVIHTRSDLYRGEKKGLQIVLSYSQAEKLS